MGPKNTSPGRSSCVPRRDTPEATDGCCTQKVFCWAGKLSESELQGGHPTSCFQLWCVERVFSKLGAGNSLSFLATSMMLFAALLTIPAAALAALLTTRHSSTPSVSLRYRCYCCHCHWYLVRRAGSKPPTRRRKEHSATYHSRLHATLIFTHVQYVTVCRIPQPYINK